VTLALSPRTESASIPNAERQLLLPAGPSRLPPCHPGPTGAISGEGLDAQSGHSRAVRRPVDRYKYTQLNSDVFTSVVDLDGHQTVEEYRKAKEVEGLQQASIYEAMLTLGHFKRLAAPDSSKAVTQNVLDQFILDRGREVSRNTLNKDIRDLAAFLSWAIKNRFVCPGLEIRKAKVAQKPVTALSPQQVRGLLLASI